MATVDRFIQEVRANRFNRAILERWDALALPASRTTLSLLLRIE